MPSSTASLILTLVAVLTAGAGCSNKSVADPKTAPGCYEGAEGTAEHGVRTGVSGAKTGATTAIEGVKTFGSSAAGFVEGGSDEAKARWKEGAAETKETAREGKGETKQVAHTPRCR